MITVRILAYAFVASSSCAMLVACKGKEAPPSQDSATASGTVAPRAETSATTAGADTSGTGAARADTAGAVAPGASTGACCGGGMPGTRGMSGMRGMRGMRGMNRMRGMMGASSASGAPATGLAPAGATPQMVTEGDSIFHGQMAGGLCFTCHGTDARGTAIAPSLADDQWITGDGSYAFIVKRVTDGMPKPTPPYTSAMPPMGGAQLTPQQVKAVAAYVYAISHRSR